MTTRKKKAEASGDNEEVTQDSILDRLTALRSEITDNASASARLLDILIDANGGDSVELLADIESGRQSDAARLEAGDEGANSANSTNSD